VGYFDFHGNADFCIAIRTATFERGKIHCGVGAGSWRTPIRTRSGSRRGTRGGGREAVRLAARGYAMILMIDNYDSFTWNCAVPGELGSTPEVVRNDEITWASGAPRSSPS